MCDHLSKNITIIKKEESMDKNFAASVQTICVLKSDQETHVTCYSHDNVKEDKYAVGAFRHDHVKEDQQAVGRTNLY